MPDLVMLLRLGFAKAALRISTGLKEKTVVAGLGLFG
jgi:hypothetical protein